MRLAETSLQGIGQAVATVVAAGDAETANEMARVESDLLSAFNRDVCFTDVKAYVQANSSLSNQLDALPRHAIILEASP